MGPENDVRGPVWLPASAPSGPGPAGSGGGGEVGREEGSRGQQECDGRGGRGERERERGVIKHVEYHMI